MTVLTREGEESLYRRLAEKLTPDEAQGLRNVVEFGEGWTGVASLAGSRCVGARSARRLVDLGLAAWTGVYSNALVPTDLGRAVAMLLEESDG